MRVVFHIYVMVKSEDNILHAVWSSFPERKDPYNKWGFTRALNLFEICCELSKHLIDHIWWSSSLWERHEIFSSVSWVRNHWYSDMFSFILQEVLSPNIHMVQQWTIVTNLSLQLLLYFHPLVSFCISVIFTRLISLTSMITPEESTQRQKLIRWSVNFTSFVSLTSTRPSFANMEASGRTGFVRVGSH